MNLLKILQGRLKELQLNYTTCMEAGEKDDKEITYLHGEIDKLQGENEVLREQNFAMNKTIAENRVELEEAVEKMRPIVEVMKSAYSALDSLPVDCLGSAFSPDVGEWGIRDELMHYLGVEIKNGETFLNKQGVK